MSTTYEKPAMTVEDLPVYTAVKAAIESSMASNRVGDLFKSIARADLRVREFEKVLGQGLLGKTTASEYSRLQNGDQGQIRELYLASLERVAPELREKFFKLYAYY